MEAEPIVKDSALRSDEILTLARLLKEALCIEHDLTRRLSKRPAEKSLLRQYKEYRQLVGQLTWELERTLARYLTRSKAATGPTAGTQGVRPSGRASAAFRPEWRRTPDR
jgi:hypothetical protein